MSAAVNAWKFLARNRTKIGGLITMVGGYIATLGHDYDGVSKLLLTVGGLIAGSGLASSDAQVKAKQEFEQQGTVDRRER